MPHRKIVFSLNEGTQRKIVLLNKLENLLMQMENELVSSEQRPKNQDLWVGPGFPTMTHLFHSQQPRWMPDTDERKNQRD